VVAEGVLNEIVRRLVAGFAPEQIILFGSQARGSADPRSDVDLLVIRRLDGAVRRKLATAMDLSLAGLGIARDVIVLTPEEFERQRQLPGTVARPAWLEGRTLYARTA
jgi:uncharacterized protein